VATAAGADAQQHNEQNKPARAQRAGFFIGQRNRQRLSKIIAGSIEFLLENEAGPLNDQSQDWQPNQLRESSL
jgi:hypothetical protein